MPLDTLDSWNQTAPPEILKVIREGTPPDHWDACRYTAWEEVLRLYCQANLNEENLEFLWEVEDYKEFGAATSTKAEEIIEDIIIAKQLNLYGDSKGPIMDWYETEGHQVDPELFDRALDEVLESFSPVYANFFRSASAAHADMLQAEQFADGTQIEVGELEEQDLQIDRNLVTEWNKKALKELKVKGRTGFFQDEDLVIIQHPTLSEGQPYWAWATTRDRYNPGSYVEMVRKGNLFGTDPGEIRVVGANTGASVYIDKAVAEVSNKDVTYG